MKEIEDIHKPFRKWLDERQIPYVYHRPDCRSGIAEGHPDFTVLWMRRQVMIECKTQSGKLSDKQVKRIDYLRRNGNVVEIARNLDECVEAVKSILCEGTKPSDTGGHCDWPLKECFRDLRMAVQKVKPTPHLDCVGGDDQGKASVQTLPVNVSEEGADSKTPHLFVGYLGNTPYVFQGSGMPGSMATRVRTATADDLRDLPRG